MEKLHTLKTTLKMAGRRIVVYIEPNVADCLHRLLIRWQLMCAVGGDSF